MQNKEENNYIKFLYGRLETAKIIDINKEQKKYKLLEEGLKLTRENTKDDLKICFLNCGDDSYSMCIFKTLILCLKKLHNNESVENVLNLLNSLKLTPFMIREVACLLAHFSSKSEEIKVNFENFIVLSKEEKELYFGSSYLISEEMRGRN